MGLTPGINPMGGPPQPTGAPPPVITGMAMGGSGMPALPPVTPPAVTQAAPQQAQQQHDSLVGRAFKALSGQETQYGVDPQSGQMVQTPVKNTPGQFFKNVVAAALIGGATGADNAGRNQGSGLAAAMQGGRAVMDHEQALNQQRINQAQIDYQNQLKAQENQRQQATADREAQEAPLRQQLLKAQIANYNVDAFQKATEAHGKDLTYHVALQDRGKQMAQALYGDNGIDPVKRALPESEVEQYIKENAGAGTTLIPFATGIKQTLDANGQPVWENTYDLYKGNQAVPVTKAWLNTPEMQALKTDQPDYFKVLEGYAASGKEIDPQQKLSILSSANTSFGRQQAHQTAGLELKKTQGAIDEAKARVKEYIAEANRANAEAGKAAFDLKQQKDAENALTAVLTGNNGVGKDGKPLPVNGKQYAAALPYLRDDAKSAHDNWVAAIQAADKGEPGDKALQDQVLQAGQAAANAQRVLDTVIQRAQGTGNSNAGGATQPAGAPGPAQIAQRMALFNPTTGTPTNARVSIEDARRNLDQYPSKADDPVNGITDEQRGAIEKELNTLYGTPTTADKQAQAVAARKSARNEQRNAAIGLGTTYIPQVSF